jgi:hypothetical protein
LHLLSRANDDRVPDIAATDLVRNAAVVRALGAEVSLFLNHNHNSVTYSRLNHIES